LSVCDGDVISKKERGRKSWRGWVSGRLDRRKKKNRAGLGCGEGVVIYTIYIDIVSLGGYTAYDYFDGEIKNRGEKSFVCIFAKLL